MPLKKAILFIDGSNFYHALKQNNMFNQFSYQSLFEELSKEFSIKKVFYYDANKSRLLEPEQYSKQQRFHERLIKEMPNVVIQGRKLKYLTINNRVEEAKNHAKFCKDCKSKIDAFLTEAGLK